MFLFSNALVKNLVFFLECGCKGNTFFCNYQIFFRFFQKKHQKVLLSIVKNALFLLFIVPL